MLLVPGPHSCMLLTPILRCFYHGHTFPLPYLYCFLGMPLQWPHSYTVFSLTLGILSFFVDLFIFFLIMAVLFYWPWALLFVIATPLLSHEPHFCSYCLYLWPDSYFYFGHSFIMGIIIFLKWPYFYCHRGRVESSICTRTWT